MEEAAWTRRVKRERTARREAEKLLESKSLELYTANQKLQNLNDTLERRVEERTEELKQALERAIAAEKAAEKASQARSDFFTCISHEMRTPMAAIIGYGELLDDAKLDDPEHASWARHLRENGEYMMSLVEDVLNFSRLEAGQLQVHTEATDIRAVVQEVVRLLTPRARRQGINLVVDIDDALPLLIESDPRAIRQILFNLGTNALRFTLRGAVTFRVSVQDENMALSVIDTGLGIASGDLERIWKPFEQGRHNPYRSLGGTGLGLTICRELSHLLGGSMDVESALDKGSRFTMTAPIVLTHSGQQVASRAIVDEEPKASLEGLRVLIVDDSPDNRRLESLLVRRAGAEVETSEDGQQAVDRIIARRERFDIILMDIQMPILDGLQATITLRKGGFTAPIIAVTADATERTRKQIEKGGFTGRLIKPISPRKLIRQIIELCVDVNHVTAPAVQRPSWAVQLQQQIYAVRSDRLRHTRPDISAKDLSGHLDGLAALLDDQDARHRTIRTLRGELSMGTPPHIVAGEARAALIR
ncbi:MAG: ATP-binding protein [Myxococcota bacterium]